MIEKIWSVYLLYNSTINRTYIGCTTDVVRRLRQHNGEIRGGARATSRAKGWQLVAHAEGFLTKSSACRWERIVKCRAKGLEARRNALMLVVAGYCPPGKHYPVPEGLMWVAAVEV